MEHGPSTVNAASAAADALSLQLGLDGERRDLGPGIRRRYLVGTGRLSGIPIHPLGFLVSDYLSPGARLRLLVEWAIPRKKGGNEETVAEFSVRRFGSEFTDRVIDPLLAGLYAGKASTLSMMGVFPKLIDFERDYGSVTLAMLSRHRIGADGHRRPPHPTGGRRIPRERGPGRRLSRSGGGHRHPAPCRREFARRRGLRGGNSGR